MGSALAKAEMGRAGRSVRRLLLGLAAAALFLLALLAVNQEQVSIRFLAWRTPEWSLFWWLLIAFLAGAAVGVLTLLPARARSALQTRRLRKEVRQAHKAHDPPQN